MATRDEIKKAILDVAGNPEGGVVPRFVDAWADAIVELDAPVKAKKPEVKETRVITPEEER